jgi:hypothetical protein
MYKEVTNDLLTRLEVLEADIKNIKWTVVECMKIVEQNEFAIDSISRILQKDPDIMRKPTNRGGRPKLAIKVE